MLLRLEVNSKVVNASVWTHAWMHTSTLASTDEQTTSKHKKIMHPSHLLGGQIHKNSHTKNEKVTSKCINLPMKNRMFP